MKLRSLDLLELGAATAWRCAPVRQIKWRASVADFLIGQVGIGSEAA